MEETQMVSVSLYSGKEKGEWAMHPHGGGYGLREMSPEEKKRCVLLRALMMEWKIPPVTRKNIMKMYESLDVGEAFGRPEMMQVLERELTTVSLILNKMKAAGMLERADDVGRGKYRFREFREEESAWISGPKKRSDEKKK